MNEVLNHTGRCRAAPRFLAWMLAALCVVLPVAHVRAVQNSLIGLVVLAFAVCLAGNFRAALHGLPRSLLGAGGAWLALCLLSATWSGWPWLSLEMAVASVGLPFVLFLAARWLVREGGGFPVVLAGGLAGQAVLVALALALLCLGKMEVLSSGLDYLVAADPVLRRYPGPGLMSSFVVLGLPLVLLAAQNGRWRRLSIALGALLLLAGVVSFNRMFWPVLAAMLLVGGVFLVAGRRLSLRPRHAGVALALAVLMGLGVVGSTVVRVQLLGGDAVNLSGAGQRITDDPRRVIWTHWVEAGRAQPWLGVGFGKENARRALNDRFANIPADQMDPAGHSHPHNLLLSIWIQLGFVGVAVFLWLLGSLLLYVWRLRSKRGAAVLAMLVTGMLVKNLTDDFYNVALPSLFWIYAGLMAGVLSTEREQS